MDEKTKENIKWLTNCFLNELIEQDFFVCVLCATTGSVYLSVDFDLCGKIRISDHWSSKDSDVLYNVCVQGPGYQDPTFYALKKSKSLVRKIVKSCMEQRKRTYRDLGWGKYKSFMERNNINVIEVSEITMSTLILSGERDYRKIMETRSKSSYFKKYFPKENRFGKL